MRTSVGAVNAGTGKSVRYCSCSTPPCAAMVRALIYIASQYRLASAYRTSPLMTAIKVPPLGESIVEATISRWTKQPGDAVAAGATLVELETDKVTVEGPALRPGVMGAHAKAEGDVVKVDEVLGELDERAVPAVAAGTVGAGTVAAGTVAGGT